MGLMGMIIARYPGWMRASPFTDLRHGIEFLWHHPLWSLGLAGLGTLLCALAPLLLIRSHLPDTPEMLLGLTVVTVLPMNLYFIPRFQLAMDAEILDDPRNPKQDWKATFESRWLLTIGAKLLLELGFCAGFLFFFIPGFLVLTLFGWVPMRVLLRGESIREAMKASARVMALHWRPVVLSAVVLTSFCLLAGNLVTFGLTHSFQKPTAWQQLTHFQFWASNFVDVLFSLWLSAAFLSLFHRLEAEPEAPK